MDSTIKMIGRADMSIEPSTGGIPLAGLKKNPPNRSTAAVVGFQNFSRRLVAR